MSSETHVRAARLALGLIASMAAAAGLPAWAAQASRPVPSPSSGRYYIVTRPDPRDCPSPTCGGYFVKEVNKASSRCADGTWQVECHAAEVDDSTLFWTDEDRVRFAERFSQGQALARGRLEQRSLGSATAFVLVVGEGWIGQALSSPRGTFHGLRESGILCLTYPCASIDERLLNLIRHQRIAEVDLAASGAGPEKVAAGYEALSQPPGILAAGRHVAVEGPGGTSRALIASEFYLVVPVGAGTSRN